MECTVGQVIGGLISRSQCIAASSLGLCKAVESICYDFTKAGGQETMGSSLFLGCVSVDEIVCMQNEPIDLYLESLENLLCLKACGRVSLFISRDCNGSIEWHMVQLSWVGHETLFLFLIQRFIFSLCLSYNHKILGQERSR